MVQMQVFLKSQVEEGWHFCHLIFSRFIILHLEITICKIKEKLFFFCHHNFRKKGHS